MTISIPYWTRCYCPISSKMEEIKNTPFFKFFKFFSGDLKSSSWGQHPGFNLRNLESLQLFEVLWGWETAPGILLKESRIPLALWGLWGWETAPGIQLKESGIPLALWGALEVGYSTRDSTEGIRNPSSSSGGSGGGGQEKSPPEFFLASQLNVFHHD